MAYVPDDVVEAMRSSHMLGLFLHVATDPPLHLWFGMEDVIAGIESIDPEGTTYMGGGELIGVPTLEVLVNGTADRVEFTLSGLEPGTGSKLIDSIPPVRGCDVIMGLTTLDDLYQPMSAIVPVWSGTASHTGESSPPVMGTESPTLTLALAVVTGETARSRPARSIWSPTHQKAISPTDKFCDETARLARGVDPTWTLGY